MSFSVLCAACRVAPRSESDGGKLPVNSCTGEPARATLKLKLRRMPTGSNSRRLRGAAIGSRRTMSSKSAQMPVQMWSVGCIA
jgi:hypothetical protein